jgi:hypothetical protein
MADTSAIFYPLGATRARIAGLLARGAIDCAGERGYLLPATCAGEDVNKLLTEMPDHPAVWSYGGTGEVSREFIDLVSEFQSGQEYNSLTAALLCREAYELGRREGRMCSPKEAITTILVVSITLLLLGAYLAAHGP